MIELLWIIPAVIAVLFVLYALAVNGRAGHPGLKNLQGHVFAHRGLHNKERPENSLSAFRAARDKAYGIELDIHLLKDGTLAVFHDHTLKRTTGAKGVIEDLTVDQLGNYTLEGTAETIPTFREVLALLNGKVPLIVELKAANNHRALVDAAMKQLREYNGVYCIESFDPRCLWHLRRRYPGVIRGQLSQNFIGSKEKLSGATKFVLTHLLTNFLTRPDFVAHKFSDRKTLSVVLARKLWRVQGVVWTLTDKRQHDQALREGYLPIFEHYEP